MEYLITARIRPGAKLFDWAWKMKSEVLAINLFLREDPDTRDRATEESPDGVEYEYLDVDGEFKSIFFDIEHELPGHDKIDVIYYRGLGTGGGWVAVVDISSDGYSDAQATLWELTTGAFHLIFDIQAEPLVDPYKRGHQPDPTPREREQWQIRRLVPRDIGKNGGW